MTLKELQEKFGSRILELVKGASEKLENRDNTSWEQRKQHTINYIKTADREVQYITCADKNMYEEFRSVVESLFQV